MKITNTEVFTLSTAEDQVNYFSGEFAFVQSLPDADRILIPGTYRVIEGRLLMIVPGSPFEPSPEQ